MTSDADIATAWGTIAAAVVAGTGLLVSLWINAKDRNRSDQQATGTVGKKLESLRLNDIDMREASASEITVEIADDINRYLTSTGPLDQVWAS